MSLVKLNSRSGLTAGITMADAWRITANFEKGSSGSAYLTSNWERVDTDGFGQIGTGMSNSSGEFSFPSTGIYFIHFQAYCDGQNGASTYAGIRIETTTLDKEIDKIQQRIKLIKLEAEGFEPEILQGLKKYLNYVEYITIDCGFERGVKQESTIAECANYLIKNNFKMIDFSLPRVVTLFKNLNK